MADESVQRHRPLRGPWLAVFVALTLAGLFLAINHLFNLRFFVGFVLLENRYLYLLLATFFSSAFLLFPAGKGRGARVPWYDLVLFFAALVCSCYFAWHGERMVREAWEFQAPAFAVGVGVVLWLLLLEGARRTGGLALALILLVFSLYPVYAGWLPGPIAGFSLSFADTIRYQTASVEAVLGIPMRVFGNLLVGFILFGAALHVTGAGRFFTNASMALLGNVRGGTAKVAVVASGLFGTMSGSSVSNVLATGVVTIPAMKRTGFRPEDAAAVEANASSGGVLTPPVMGAVAFVMASVLGTPYVYVAAAAAVPAFLFYLSLFLQIDAYAAKYGIRGLPRVELPSLRASFKEGWFYMLAFGLLIFLLVYLRQEALAPFYATALLLVLAMLRRDTRWTASRVLSFVVSTGQTLVELVTILAAVGLLIGGLTVTGVIGTFTSDVVRIAGGNVTALVLLTAVACFILGTGLTITASYIFLAIMMAPALVQQGMNPMAVHLFILYWAVLSEITPPVALSVVAASGLAGAPVMRSMMEAMRFGAVKYALPFFFIYNPALVLQGATPLVLLEVVLAAVIGLALVAYALQGYLPWIGTLNNNPLGYATRLLLIGAGLLLALPERLTTLAGLGVAAIVYGGGAFACRTGWLPLVRPES
ncbi:MAG: Sialic acid TRAP transporter permease protein siaT [Candidatus Rokubacteria bacterium CSP1-6]|nr:MAG: Sialic acid TRAP transporter permease protein siaT [Candidatus Rokubacteria bacterium CSP1-6]